MAMTVEEFVQHCDGVADELDRMNFQDALEECIPILQEGFTDNFALSRAPDGTPWAARKDTKAQNPILILTSELLRSVGGQTGDSIERIDDTVLTLGTKDKKAAFHEHGTKHMVARPFMGVDESKLDDCEEVLARHFGNILAGD